MAEVAALLPNGKELALKDYKKSLDEECGTPPEQFRAFIESDIAKWRKLVADAGIKGE